VAGVADHVAVGVVDAGEAVAPGAQLAIRRSVISAAFIHGRCSNGAGPTGSRRRSRALVEHAERLPFQKYVTWPYFWVSLIASWAHAGGGQQLAHRALDLRRRHQVVARQVQRSPSYCIMPAKSTSGPRPAIERGELRVVEGAGDLDRAVAAEVEHHHRVAVAIGATGARVVGDHERRQVLIDDAGVLVAQRRDRGARRWEAAALAEHVGAPAALDDAPVGLVAIHRVTMRPPPEAMR
jgi:hypothetical protein